MSFAGIMISVGDNQVYDLSYYNGNWWLSNREGEGLKIDNVKLYELLDKYFKENYGIYEM